MNKPTDLASESLLALDGDRYFIDGRGTFEVIFRVRRDNVTLGRPHGLKYSLVLLNDDGERLICFDNAHGVKHGSGQGKRNLQPFDHRHVGTTVRPYEFVDAFTLLADFWKEVDKLVLQSVGARKT